MRFLHDVRGQAVAVEFAVLFLLLVGFLGGFLTYALAAHARSAIIQATDAGGRLLAIECDPQHPRYSYAYSDAEALVAITLQDAGLTLGSQPAAPGTPGSYSVVPTCDPSTGEATIDVTFEQRDIFPVLGHVLVAGPDNTGGTFQLQTGAAFSIE